MVINSISNNNQRQKLRRIHVRLKRLKNKSKLEIPEHREQFELYRSVIHLFEDTVRAANLSGVDLGPKSAEFKHLANEAMINLGGIAEPSLIPLQFYEHLVHGPYLGVSDEGSAANEFRRAILCSPKAEVLGPQSPIVVGAALDAERLAAVGEVAVGPDEYHRIWLACQGSVLMSTNVGTRLNLRYYRMRPSFEVRDDRIDRMVAASIREAASLIEPFWKTPNGKPRPVTIFISFQKGIHYNKRLCLLREMKRHFATGNSCNPSTHMLGLLAQVGSGKKGLRIALRNIDIACAADIKEVAIQGYVTKEADDQISMPGLLNYFDAESVRVLIQSAKRRGITLSPKHLVDPDTVARNVWAPLCAARNMGLALGKYGLFPLTLEESDEVMKLVQSWFTDWCAAPVCYVDLPIVGKYNIYTEDKIISGMKAWLDIVAKHKIPIVLFDTANKAKGRRLLKESSNDKIGILHQKEIRELDKHARKRNIRALWAGGINLEQVLTFGMLEVFGIYVTSAATVLKPVSAEYARDPSIAAEKEITFSGVSQTKLLLEAGFLISRLQKLGLRKEVQNIKKASSVLIRETNLDPESGSCEVARLHLHNLTVEGWKRHYQSVKSFCSSIQPVDTKEDSE